MVELQKVAPEQIEEESFRIIEEEFEERTGKKISSYSPEIFQVIRRVIHATGDFAFASYMQFSKNSIETAVASLGKGRGVYVDVGMAQAGISKILTEKFGNSIHCLVHDPKVVEKAKKENLTRSEAAIDMLESMDIGLIVVGNAPTALIRAIKLIKAGRLSPDLIVGVPVGFVNAAESKEMLVESGICSITCRGRRGGSPVAAAIVNALLKMV